jgi:hypothetical protein
MMMNWDCKEKKKRMKGAQSREERFVVRLATRRRRKREME